MEKGSIQDVLNCQYGTNCTFLNNCLTENITLIIFDTVLLSKLHIWEDYIVAVHLFAVNFLYFFSFSKLIKKNVLDSYD